MTRKCPRTGTALRAIKLGGVTIDFSDACGGVFFDRFELQRFDEEVEIRGEYLAELMEKAANPFLDTNSRIKCPNCPDVVMMRRAYSPLNKIELDECPSCAGVWLDAGELATLRKNFPTDDTRKQVAEKYVNEIMSSPEVLENEKKISEIQADGERIKRRLWKLIGL